MKARDMVEGQWYRLVPNTCGRFVAGNSAKCGQHIGWRFIFLDGDRDMQSTELLAPIVEVEPAEPRV